MSDTRDICVRLDKWRLYADGSLSDDLREARAEIERLRADNAALVHDIGRHVQITADQANEIAELEAQRNAAWRALDTLDTAIDRLNNQAASDMLGRIWGDHTGAMQAACAFVVAEQASKEVG